MAVYENRAGRFVLTVSEPSPMWVSLADDEGFRHIKSDDLYDLRHLIDRAIAAVEATR